MNSAAGQRSASLSPTERPTRPLPDFSMLLLLQRAHPETAKVHAAKVPGKCAAQQAGGPPPEPPQSTGRRRQPQGRPLLMPPLPVRHSRAQLSAAAAARSLHGTRGPSTSQGSASALRRLRLVVEEYRGLDAARLALGTHLVPAAHGGDGGVVEEDEAAWGRREHGSGVWREVRASGGAAQACAGQQGSGSPTGAAGPKSAPE